MTTILYPLRKNAVASNAALATWLAMRAGGPGVIADPIAMRGFHNHPSNARQFATFLLTFDDCLICIYPDQSAVVGRVLENGQWQLVPSLFRIREWPLQNGMPTFKVKRFKGPMKIENSDKIDAGICVSFGPKDSLPPQSPDTLTGSYKEAWDYFTQCLQTQVCAIAQTLNSAKWVGLCDGDVLPKTVDQKTLEQQGLPQSALGQPLTTPDWLPQRRTSVQKINALQNYCQDFLDWVMMTYAKPGLITRCSMTIQGDSPQSHRPSKEFSRFMVHMTANKSAWPAWHPSSMSWNAESLLTTIDNWSPPEMDSFDSYLFQAEKTFEHQVKRDVLFNIEGRATLSAHDCIRLKTIFGDGIPLLEPS